ncbi:MAG: uroporphyrinogen decarboxylase family protein [Planctomycetota bacterium]|jgi:uroporphyrinogen-III decarboxylase|nr:uroporphyrinogen decarboxylase family protein [Planctomycetota bacterium]MDP7249985.1 uroporphyrinogen decarboxylase family protein [Planctomycetota bacterium]
MTPRERWLAAIRCQPVDRFPFWPKLNGAYARMQQAPFREMKAEAIHDWVGSDKHIGISGCVREIRKETSVEASRDNGTQRTFYETPSGRTELVNRFDSASQSWHPTKFPVQSLDDLKVMTEYYEDCQVEFDEQGVEQARNRVREIGEDAITTNGIGTSPIMQWVQWIAGVENAHYLLIDHPGEVEALFDAMYRPLRRKAEILADKSPCDIFYLVENTSTTLISPEQYRRYSYPHVMECARIVSDAGRKLVLHMCGHLKTILPDLANLPAAAFEAFTSPPVGNTTLLDGRTGCPDKCLIGGTNAALWTRSAEEIIERIGTDLDELPHHRGIVVTSAGVMPPICSPETIKEVSEWLRSYEPRQR